MERAENTRNTATAERGSPNDRTSWPERRRLSDRHRPGRRQGMSCQPILPVQRGLTDTARDAAGYLLTLLATSAALVLAREQRDRGVRRGARVDRLPWLGRDPSKRRLRRSACRAPGGPRRVQRGHR